MWFHEQQMGEILMKKTDAELIWEALLAKAQQSLLDENNGIINRQTLDALELQRDQNDLELSDEEKAVLDQMIEYLTRRLPPERPYKKANKILAMRDYIERLMKRG